MRHALAPKTRTLAPLLGIAKINLSNTHKLATDLFGGQRSLSRAAPGPGAISAECGRSGSA